MKRVWELESQYYGDEISMLPGADLIDLLIEDHFTIKLLKPKVSYYAKKAVQPVFQPSIEEESDTEIEAINQSAAAILTRIRSVSISSPDSEGESDTEIAAVNQSVTASLTRISELSDSTPSIRTKSPPMLIPRKNTPSPRTVNPLVTVSMAGSPERHPLPSAFLMPPMITAAGIAAAKARRSKAPVIFRGNSSSSLVSFHTLTPGSTPTSVELLAQEAGASVLPGLTL